MAQSLVAAANYRRLAPIRVCREASDHPWNGQDGPGAQKESILAVVKLTLIIVLAFALLASVSDLRAQTRVIPVEPETETPKARSKADLEAAKDYEDFIARLQKLAYDYQGYLSKYNE